MYLQLDQLSVRYESQSAASAPAVNQVSFGLKAGEIGVLIGPSGCGHPIAGRGRVGGRI
jgi:iron(III) transport system ATP-binding protein